MHFMQMTWIRPSLLFMASLILPAIQAAAQPAPALEAKIEIRVLDFVAEPADRATVGVLYDRDNAASLKEANAILQAFVEAAGMARKSFTPKLVERHTLDRETGLKGLVLTPSLPASLDDVSRYGIKNHAVILSSGLDCVRRHQCTVGVVTAPEVEIGVSPDIIRKSGIRFADGFQVMAKEY